MVAKRLVSNWVFTMALLLCSFVVASAQPSAPSWSIGPGLASSNSILAFTAIERYTRDSAGNFKLVSGAPVESVRLGMNAFDFYKVESACHVEMIRPGSTTPIRLFPRPEHQSILDAPYQLGCATELRMSLDGRKIYVGYYHKTNDGSRSSGTEVPLLGADIYRIDVGPFIDNPSYNGAVNVTRLTRQPTNRFEEAMNPTTASSTALKLGGVLNTAAVEMMTDRGLELVFTSNMRSLQDSNSFNVNMNLFHALIKEDGTLGPINQFQYYTTTSVISPINLINGIAASYQERITDFRHWTIQQMNSAGQWAPLDGYGSHTTTAVHNGDLCQMPGGRRFLLSTGYYHAFNEGFGAIKATDIATAGINNTSAIEMGAYVTAQVNSDLISKFTSTFEDQPGTITVGGNLQLVGKFATPGCGADGKVFLAYTNTCANTRNVTDPCWQAFGSLGRFHSGIVVRDGILNQSGMIQAEDPRDTNIFKPVIKDTAGLYSLAFPVVVGLPFAQKVGAEPQFTSTFSNKSGMPEAMIGTSALHNTDLTVMECATRGPTPKFDSNVHFDQNLREISFYAISKLNWVRDPAKLNASAPDSVCEKPLNPEDILGVEIIMTDNKMDPAYLNPIADRDETQELLGVVPAGVPHNGTIDTSFRALIPSNVPFKMRPLSKYFGLAYAEAPNWHSLKAGESRHDCGGCHNHKAGMGINYEGTRASEPTYPAPDLLNTTPRVKYDVMCQPTIQVENRATRPIPVWGDGTPLFQKFTSYCGSCHSAGQSGAPAFVVGNADATFEALFNPPPRNGDGARRRRYISKEFLAQMSQAWWAARGMRADGRDNSFYLNPANADLEFQFTEAPHVQLGLCNGTRQDAQDAADWVYDFGSWIDNGMHRTSEFPTTGPAANFPYEYDRFHPAVNAALVDSTGCSIAQGLKVGFWDNRGVVQVQLKGPNLNLTRQITSTDPSGFEIFTEIANSQNSSDVYTAIAIDAAGNRQSYKFTTEQLSANCVTGSDPRAGIIYNPEGNEPGGSFPPGSAGLTFSGSTVQQGQLVTATVRANLDEAGKVFVLAGSATGTNGVANIGTEPGSSLELVDDRYFKNTARYMTGTLVEEDGKAVGRLQFIIPNNAKKGIKLYHQAAVLSATGGISAKSGHVKLTVSTTSRQLPPNKLEKSISTASGKIKQLKRRLAAGRNNALKQKLKSMQSDLKAAQQRLKAAKTLGKRTVGVAR